MSFNTLSSGRRFLIIWLIALLAEAALVWSFRQIPNARSFIPLRITDDPQVYDWPPDDAPRWFHTDDPAVDEATYFREAIQSEIDPSSATFGRQIAIMDWVRRQAVVADATLPITGDPIAVHQAMLNGIPAQCSNFSTLYTATSAGARLLNVRTWHFASDGGWDGYGHIANDVWVPELGVWVMIDPMNNTYVLVDGAPASIIEVREAVLTGQTDRVEFVIGPNAHTPPDRLFELYAQTMQIVSMEASFTPLRDAYTQTPIDRLIHLLPGAGGLPYYADRLVSLVSGEARHVTLIDDLSGERAHQLPIWQSKALFWAMVILGIVILVIGIGLTWLAARQLTHRFMSYWASIK